MNSSNPSATSRPKSVRPGPLRRGRAILLTAWPVALGVLGGCNTAELDTGFKQLFQPRRTPQQNMLIAVSDPDPDQRRDAAAKLAGSEQVSKEWAINGLTAVALLERNPQTRCVAIRGLARSGDPRAVETCLKILNHTKHPPGDVRSPEPDVRWDATLALAEFSERGLVPEEQKDAVHQTLLERLRNDDNRHVRIACARGLACYPTRDTADGLIQALRDQDAAIAIEAARSLNRLTGQRFGADAYAWRDWLEHNPDSPLAVTPPGRPRAWWQNWTRGMQDTYEWLFPGPKAR